ncbi:hypothetical protein MN116_006181 [Schistosoma mekongi]|uniref:39S ribosomal protein L42, mitochondrial n=1 Tax=Schistosoma mekongi TaxID=38744 RepID=A0AAE1ZCC2_SCHME|nr:hypothetical protein MN116_006181 [Schistosoma mekongi]
MIVNAYSNTWVVPSKMFLSKTISFIQRKPLQINTARVYRSSKELIESGESAITLSPDGAVVVCWHPVRKVPYECTKPISHDIKSLRIPTSPLQINAVDTLVKKSAEPTIVELSKAFGVPWFHFRPRRNQKTRSPYFWAPFKERTSL